MKHVWLLLLSSSAIQAMERQALPSAPSEPAPREEAATPPLPDDPIVARHVLNAELISIQSTYKDLLQHEPVFDERQLSRLDQVTIAAGLASALVIADRQTKTRLFLTEGSYTPWIVAGIASFWQFMQMCYYRFGRWRARVNNAEMQDTIKKNLGPRLTTLEGNVRKLTQNADKRLESMEKKQSLAETTVKNLHSEMFRLANELDELKKQLKKKS